MFVYNIAFYSSNLSYMVRTHFLIFFALLAIVQFSRCHRYEKRVQFDNKTWKEDKNGCLGKRGDIYESLMAEKEALLRINEKQLVNILGLPEANELTKRNQKFFVYTIFPDEKCSSQSEEKLYLIIRFNAVGLSSEIFVLDTPGPF